MCPHAKQCFFTVALDDFKCEQTTIKESVHEKKSINHIRINILHVIIFIMLKIFVIVSDKYLLHLKKYEH
jgi:hypothetical protein